MYIKCWPDSSDTFCSKIGKNVDYISNLQLLKKILINDTVLKLPVSFQCIGLIKVLKLLTGLIPQLLVITLC